MGLGGGAVSTLVSSIQPLERCDSGRDRCFDKLNLLESSAHLGSGAI